MRRGFKAQCERASHEHRDALGLPLDAALDLDALARRLGVVVWTPEDVPDLSPESLAQLVRHDKASWSAVTLRSGDTHLTIINSAHAPVRQRSSLAHELSHLLLQHTPDRIDVSEEGHLLLSSFEGDQEEEADWLAGALLVPREGLRRAYRRTTDLDWLADRFLVSQQLLRWRLGQTGVAIQARRANAYR